MWSKGKFVSNTIVGSISGAKPFIIGWSTIDPALSIKAIALFLIMFTLQTAHFYVLAMKRTEEYRATNIPMLPVVKGFLANEKIHVFMGRVAITITTAFSRIWYKLSKFWLHY